MGSPEPIAPANVLAGTHGADKRGGLFFRWLERKNKKDKEE